MHRFIHQWCEQASQNAVAMMLWPTRAGPGYPGNCGLFWSQESEECECARRSVPPPSPRSFIFHFLSCLSLGWQARRESGFLGRHLFERQDFLFLHRPVSASCSSRFLQCTTGWPRAKKNSSQGTTADFGLLGSLLEDG